MKIRLRTLAILAMLGVAAAAVFVYLGIYNIAATEQHTQPVYKLLDYAMHRAVKYRSEAIVVPDLSGEQRIRSGLALYRAHCVQCHGAPGVAPDSFSYGMLPMPASLVATARDWPPAKLYWVVRYGIKMSGMPAWEYRFSDEEIWDVVAFVEHMPTLSPLEYQALSKKVPAHHHGTGHEHAHAHVSSEVAQQNATVLGNVEAGKKAMGQYLCVTCHQIPGITGANRHVGPPLNGIAHRKYIGGIIPNTPENMVRWLQDPKQFDPLSAMPNLGVTQKDARDMAAYLYTLEDVD